MYNNILVATDLSDESLEAVAVAGELSRTFQATVTLLYTLEDRLPRALLGDETLHRQVQREHGQMARQALEDAAETYLQGITHHTVVTEGRPDQQILRVAQEEDTALIVLASRGHGLLSHALLGSTTERVLHGASCPVLVIPSSKAAGSL